MHFCEIKKYIPVKRFVNSKYMKYACQFFFLSIEALISIYKTNCGYVFGYFVAEKLQVL